VARADSNTEEIAESPKGGPAEVHPTALVDTRAVIGAGCRIGPYCTIGADVEMGEGCELTSHVVIDGLTTLGRHNKLFPFASIGLAPQDLKYAGEPTRLEIGDYNTIREGVTIHRGTSGGGGVTRIGNHNLFMAYVHVAHDCRVGNHVILANAATLGGHVVVEDWAMVSALCPIHQYVRIGAHAIIGGGTTVTRDVLPFSKTVATRDTHAYGLNAIGLERRGFGKERIRKIHHAFRVLLASKLNTTQALERLKSEADPGADVRQLIEFIESSQLGVIK
jgi:UDP-N-acetylglucosamine acyltransferase